MDLDLGRGIGPLDLARALCGVWPAVVLAGDPAFDDSWGPLVSVRARECLRVGADEDPLGPLVRLAALAASRRRPGATAATGIAAILSYEFGGPRGDRRPGPGVPALVAWEVDAGVAWIEGRPRLAARWGATSALADEVAAAVATAPRTLPAGPLPCRRARSSLGREAYLAAARRIREHILDGDIYQANLTRGFRVEHREDRFETFARLVAATPAPRAAFVDGGDVALASVSPEVFVDVDPHGRAQTLPIKGTRARGANATDDAAAAADLLSSVKDRAELLMIVDLERNDLGRVCRTGSVAVPELATLRTFAAVHHLVARVTGRLREEVALGDWVRATFPGGSITGAPKRRAMEILRSVEPWRRGWFTGSLLWIGDDGSVRSSILIRSVSFEDRLAWLGAGGGIVAGSVPEAEWAEANAKARAPAGVLGFEPEDVD